MKNEFKKRVERSVWLAVPTKQMLMRQEIESDMVKKANKARYAHLDEKLERSLGGDEELAKTQTKKV